MTTVDTIVHRQVTVDAPVDRAFETFVERFGDFKPTEHNLLGAEIVETRFEPKVGGHIYDRAADGSECRWARGLAYEPPDRVVFSWDISPTWQLETDPAHASEVEVRFTAESPTRTRVDLEHRNLERHGPGWDLADFLAPLAPTQWNAPSLCEQWSVREVVAHIYSYEDLGPVGLTALFGGRIALTDGLIHHQDIRRPLGMPREIPADRFRCALDFALKAPLLRASKRVKGLRLAATDIDWTTGEGPLVEGPAEALLLAIAGRPAVFGELTGPGQPTLAARLS